MKLGRADAYYQETKFGARAIPSVAATTPFFTGKTEWGYIGVPIKVTSWTDYKIKFGSFISGAYLPYVVYSFFRAGGSVCYVQSLKASTTVAQPTQATIPVVDDGDTKIGDIYFNYACAAGNQFSVVCAPVPGESDLFYLRLRRNSNTIITYGPLSKDPDNVLFWEKELNKYNSNGEVINDLGSDYIYVVDSTGSSNLPKGVSAGNNSPAFTLAGGSDGIEALEADYIGVKSSKTGMYAILPIYSKIDFIANVEIFTDSYIEALVKFGAAYNIPFVSTLPSDTLPNSASSKGIVLSKKDYGEDPAEYPIDTEKININDYINSFMKIAYPWIEMYDQVKATGDFIKVPACGFEIGGYCAQDIALLKEGGISSGRNLAISNSPYGSYTDKGAFGLSHDISEEEGKDLLAGRISEVRKFYSNDDTLIVMSWGERTLSRDNDYKFFPNRRALTWIQRDMLKLGRGFVFRPLDKGFLPAAEKLIYQRLDKILKNTAGMFYSPVFAESIHLRVDDPTLNTEAILAKDMAYAEVGVRLARMVEFFIFKIGFFSGSAELVS